MAFNPLWTRLDREVDDEFGLQRLALISRGEHVVIARDLSPPERETFAEALEPGAGGCEAGSLEKLITRKIEYCCGSPSEILASGERNFARESPSFPNSSYHIPWGVGLRYRRARSPGKQLKDIFRRQVARCYTPPANVARQEAAVIEIRLLPNGALSQAPEGPERLI